MRGASTPQTENLSTDLVDHQNGSDQFLRNENDQAEKTTDQIDKVKRKKNRRRKSSIANGNNRQNVVEDKNMGDQNSVHLQASNTPSKAANFKSTEVVYVNGRQLSATPQKRDDSDRVDEVNLKTPMNKQKPKFGSARKSTQRRKIYDDHVPYEEVVQGIKSHKYLAGAIRINKKNRNDAYVTVEGMESDIRVYGLKNRNRALDGDIVALYIFEGEELEREILSFNDKMNQFNKQNNERQKKCDIEDSTMFLDSADEENDSEKVVSKADQEDISKMDEFVTAFDDNEKNEDNESEERRFGKVIHILERRFGRTFTGTIEIDVFNPEIPSGPVQSDRRLVWFRPGDKRVPFLAIRTESAPTEYLRNPAAFTQTLFSASIRGWPANNNYPDGVIHGPIGHMGELIAETEALLNENGIDWNEFPDDVSSCLPKLPWKIPEEEINQRFDLRKTHRIFSIDPQTAKDLDDALSIKQVGDNLYEVGVHIADVSYFVSPRSSLDNEAHYRATTVYLVQKAIPMLPRILCEELCSLNPDVERLAFSVFFKINSEGEVIEEPVFGRSVIKSCGKLSYDHAQALIEGVQDLTKTNLPPLSMSSDVTIDDIRQDVLALYKLSLKMREKRFLDGALTMQNIKLWFSLDDQLNPTQCGPYQLKDSNRLIEEFMLLANMAVAKKICVTYPEIALLRKHGEPKERAMRAFLDTAAKLGYSNIDASSSFSLQKSFDSIEDEDAKMILRLLCIRPMQRAKYFCTGVEDIMHFHHYALACPLYTHFTSPIRRYCDLIVHRLLDAALTGVPENGLKAQLGLDTIKVAEIAKHCNLRKEASKNAQDASQSVYLSTYLNGLSQRNPGAMVEQGLVYKVQSRSYEVLIPKYGIEKRVYVEDLMDDNLVYGSTFDENLGMLKIFWKKTGVDTLQDGISKLDLNDDNSEKTTDCQNKPVKDALIQKIKVFDKVMVQLKVLTNKSPWEIKLVGVYPKKNISIEDQNMDGRLEETQSVSGEVVCLGIIDEAD